MRALASTVRALGHAAREALRGARRRPLLPILAYAALAICLGLSGLFGLVAWNLGRAAQSWSGGGQMTVYLEDGVSSGRAAQLAEVVRRLPGVVEARLVAPKEARERLRAALGNRGELLDGVEESFLPASIEAQLRPGTSALLRAHPGYARLASTAGVEEIDLHAEVQERIAALRAICVRGAIALGLLVALCTLYLVAATIRLGVEARREELAVLRLVGATEWFVRAPFLVEGLALGLLAALSAIVALRLAYDQIAPRLGASLGDWLAAAPLSFFPLSALALTLVGGALLGLFAAGLAVTRESGA